MKKFTLPILIIILSHFASCSMTKPVSNGGIDSTDTSDYRVHKKVTVYDTVHVKVTKTDTVHITFTKRDTIKVTVTDTSFIYDTLRKSITINDTTHKQVFITDTTLKTVEIIKYDTTRKSVTVEVIKYDTTRKSITLYDTSRVNITKYDTTHKSIVLNDTIRKSITITDTLHKTIIKNDTIRKTITVFDTIHKTVVINDTVRETPTVTKFGVLPHNVDIDTKIKIAKELGVKYVREGVLSWTGRDRNIEAYQDNGFNILYNVSANGQDGKDFSKDTAGFKKTIADVLNNYSLDVIAIENEEDNWSYHGRNTVGYINELKATIPIVHGKKTKVTNGGIHDNQLLILAYRYYQNKNKDSANYILTLLTDGEKYAAQHPEKTDNRLCQKAAQTDSLLTFYKTLDLDYVNIHIYAPINDFVSDRTNVMASIKIVGDYTRMRTGKPPMSNECGQHNVDPAIVNYILDGFKYANYEYAIWFDGDGDPAMALNEPDGSLRPNGEMFKSYPK
jgi:hypothetical protein